MQPRHACSAGRSAWAGPRSEGSAPQSMVTGSRNTVLGLRNHVNRTRGAIFLVFAVLTESESFCIRHRKGPAG
jgi:hypothetical protein